VQTGNALILLSGGLDSATTAAVARADGFRCSALSFDYGQRHSIEIQSAKRLAEFFNIREHVIITIPAGLFSGSALIAGSDIEVPRMRSLDPAGEIPVTYVPARNILFLSYALAFCESRGIFDIYIGVNSIDYSGYPDCRPEFLQAFERMAELGTRSGCEGRGFRIHAPLSRLAKSDIIALGSRLGVDFSLTHSCYDPDAGGRACGVCDSCRLRRRGFAEAGIADPTVYKK